MGKNPAFQFYPNDWTRDLEEHPLEIEGAWIRICCKLWWSETRGKLTKSPLQWARVLRVTEDKAMEILNYIQSEKIGKIPQDLSQCNDIVTVMSRRMVRDNKERELTRLRVKRYREKKACNGSVTQMKQDSSSSSSSSKEIYKEKVILSQDEYKKLCEDFGTEIINSKIEDLSNYSGTNPKKFKSYQDHNLVIRTWLKKDGISKQDEIDPEKLCTECKKERRVKNGMCIPCHEEHMRA